MTPPLPRISRAILAQGSMCYLAARTPVLPGPHLTPVVFALEGRSLWVTTSRSSVKVRAWRGDPLVAGLIAVGDQAMVFRGSVRIFDALDPFTWPAATLAAPRLLRAAARYAAKNARFFAGYAVDARRIPPEWTPPGRVFVEVDMTAGRLIADDEIIEGWGEWEVGASFRPRSDPPRRGRGIDLRVPKAIRRAVGQAGQGALALDTKAGGLTVLPAPWRRAAGEGVYEITVARAVLELAGTSDRGRISRASLTVDDAHGWRASEMMGMLLQGPAEAFALPETIRGRKEVQMRLGQRTGAALVRLHPVQAVWWQGWDSATARAG